MTLKCSTKTWRIEVSRVLHIRFPGCNLNEFRFKLRLRNVGRAEHYSKLREKSSFVSRMKSEIKYEIKSQRLGIRFRLK